MRQFHKLDHNALKAFYFAAEKLNFTEAAKAASLTQSGVSQHVQKLEAELGLPLFHRGQKKMRLTESGQELKRFLESYLDSVDSFLDRLQVAGADLRGDVRYAMPDSCLFTPHFSLLLEQQQKRFPEVHLKIKICSSEDVAAHLLKREIDFGFITKTIAGRDLELKEFVREEYVLAGARSKELEFTSPQQLKNLAFISYPGMETLFDYWFASEFPKHKPIKLNELRVVGEINHLGAAITMAQMGLGIGIFQKHCIVRNLESKALTAFKLKAGRRTENPIFLVTLKDQSQPARVKAVLDAFWTIKRQG